MQNRLKKLHICNAHAHTHKLSPTHMCTFIEKQKQQNVHFFFIFLCWLSLIFIFSRASCRAFVLPILVAAIFGPCHAHPLIIMWRIFTREFACPMREQYNI